MPSPRQRARSPVRYSARRCGAERVRHEALGRQLRPIQIAAREPVAADVQLARHADRHRPARGIERCTPACSRWAGRCPDAPRLAARAPPVDQMVVSVGPYMFHSSPPSASRRSASSRGSASPPHSILRPGVPVQPLSSSSRQVAGVACNTVTLAQRRSARRACLPSSAVARSASDDAAAGGQRPEYLEARDVERQRRHRDATGRFAVDARLAMHRAQEIHHGSDARSARLSAGRSIPTCRSRRRGSTRAAGCRQIRLCVAGDLRPVRVNAYLAHGAAPESESARRS